MVGVHIIVILMLYCFYKAYAKSCREEDGTNLSGTDSGECISGPDTVRQLSMLLAILWLACLLRFALALWAGGWETAWKNILGIVSDLLAGASLFIALKRKSGGDAALGMTGIYLFNPAIVICFAAGEGQQTWALRLAVLLFLLLVNAGRSRERFISGCLKACAALAVVAGLLTAGSDSSLLYPALLLLLLLYVYSKDSRFFDCYAAFSACLLYKTAYFYYVRQAEAAWSGQVWLVVTGLLTAAAALYFFRALLAPAGDGEKEAAPVRSAGRMSFGKMDFCIIAAICLFYGCIAFWKLGITEAPITEYALPSGQSIVLELEEEPGSGSLIWYLKDSAYHTVTIEWRNSQDEPWQNAQEVDMRTVFCWGSASFTASGKYLRLTNPGSDMTIAELVIQNADGEIVKPADTAGMEALFDETVLLPEEIDYQSGAYFDECYYTRTAYEFLNGTRAFETTHPPLGKILIALGAYCFGTTPFGFRVVGVIFGILMLPFLYLLGRDITKSRLLGGFAAFLFAFDFMHFTQTRIATIDVFITFFTILMFYFMYQYSRMSFYDTPLRRTFLPLGACGVSFGLGIACKWTGFYAGAGLAVLFFLTLWRRYREYVFARKSPEGSSGGISHAYIIKSFRMDTVKTLIFCILFFVAVPFLIYLLSYLPFSNGTDTGLLARMLANQKHMFRYHTGLKADHAYASAWYEWPLMIRPVFYYSRIIDDTMRQGISAFGNPLVWWAGIPACIYMLYLCLKKKDRNAMFLCIAYAFCYLPWSLVTRCTFAYHYFPSVPIVVCMITYSFALWRPRLGESRFAALVAFYGAAAYVLFLLFYPVLSGQPVSAGYVSTFLRWLDGWVLVQ
ncbi:phospholipid carrier-dependent glycosyltransferase [Marvinbryantia formatexigens]|nr:phospholipid carrier-dependent glycosyltransferase [Marvinbryantia formatexigens]UWO26262.1 phospholipid carrier-dependent glycosyltransferase [Marvinbryantia formatexigens DSM 14469]SDG10437.1 Dolichyl-phosphate-mannose-protein mannosyltransferase [Marvinbryantia formatexigens]